jgi:hypothetical protein
MEFTSSAIVVCAEVLNGFRNNKNKKVAKLLLLYGVFFITQRKTIF